MKKFEIKNYPLSIVEVDVVRETEKCVFIVNEWTKKEVRRGKDGVYFNSYNEAKEYLIEINIHKVGLAAARLEYAEKELQKVIDL